MLRYMEQIIFRANIFFLPIFNGATIKILIRGQGKMYSQEPSVEGRKRKNIKDQK